MSERTVMSSADQLPIIPETEIIEPIVQCGVLYVGSALPSPGRRGLDSIQEPLSCRYPVDGTNKVRGIDAILSIYENGIQLTFAKQLHAVVFFPISALIYCASVRFSMIEDDETRAIGWRFTTLDTTGQNQSKHPPLFCLVVQRTQVLSGDECHCFITKDNESALALVQTISEIYAQLKQNTKLLRSPIFYQLDRYGRKITETAGAIYVSPAIDDDNQSSALADNNNSTMAINRSYLLDSSSAGFFYRTDATLIEQWQLWDDVDLNESRPRPPASPFGLHQGLYHDDLTREVHQHLCHMEEEDNSSTCSCYDSASSSPENDLDGVSKTNSRYNIDQMNTSSVQMPVGTFDPTQPIPNNIEVIRKQRQAPIVIEKVLPSSMLKVPEQHMNYIVPQTQQSVQRRLPIQPSTRPNYITISDAYTNQETDERIIKQDNDVLAVNHVVSNVMNDNVDPKIYTTSKSRSHRRRHKYVPVIDLQSLEESKHKMKSKSRRRPSASDTDSKQQYVDDSITTHSLLEVVEEYLEDHRGRRAKTYKRESNEKLEAAEASNENDQKATTPLRRRHRHKHSSLTPAKNMNPIEHNHVQYACKQTSVDRHLVPHSSKQTSVDRHLVPHSSKQTSVDRHLVPHSSKQTSIEPELLYKPELDNEQSNPIIEIDDRVLDSKPQSFRLLRRPCHQRSPESNTTSTTDEPYYKEYNSPLRYMQSSVNPSLLRAYNQALSGL